VSPDFLPPIDLKKREESIERLEKFPPTNHSKLTKKLSPPPQVNPVNEKQRRMSRIVKIKKRKDTMDQYITEDPFSDIDRDE
jgi:hypothetical protein